MKNTLLLLLLMLASVHAFAQDPIETDRPSETDATATVPKKHFQMENGFTHEQTADDARELTLPQSLFKYGLTDKLELRLITEVANVKETDTTTSGLKPVTIGFKTNLWAEKGLLPETSIIVQAALPQLASKDFESVHVAPEVRLLFMNTLSDNIDLSYNLASEWVGETGIPTYQYTVSPNFKLTNHINAFIEEYAFFPQHDKPDHWADAGLMFLITNNLQLDISGGYELTGHNHYHGYFESIGVSFRI
jgi:hypothetical protein